MAVFMGLLKNSTVRDGHWPVRDGYIEWEDRRRCRCSSGPGDPPGQRAADRGQTARLAGLKHDRLPIPALISSPAGTGVPHLRPAGYRTHPQAILRSGPGSAAMHTVNQAGRDRGSRSDQARLAADTAQSSALDQQRSPVGMGGPVQGDVCTSRCIAVIGGQVR